MMAWEPAECVIGTGMGLLISGLVAGGASAVGAKMQAGAAKRAAGVQERASDEALKLQREQLEWEREQERQARADWERREARFGPYRERGARAFSTLGDLLDRPGPGGMFDVRTGPQFAGPMPMMTVGDLAAGRVPGSERPGPAPLWRPPPEMMEEVLPSEARGPYARGRRPTAGRFPFPRRPMTVGELARPAYAF